MLINLYINIVIKNYIVDIFHIYGLFSPHKSLKPFFSCRKPLTSGIYSYLSLIHILMTIGIIFSFMIVAQAKGYTIPQAYTPPSVDGNFSKDEWYGAYNLQINNFQNRAWSSNPQRDDGCEMYDLYMT